jgi:uncharacterized iron-regulated membrane protein
VIRQTLTVAHRYVGLATAIFLVIAGLTGSLLAYYEPLSAWLSPELHRPASRGPVLSPSELAARAAASDPRVELRGFPVGEEGVGARFFVAGKRDPVTAERAPIEYDELWLDPVSGEVLGRVDRDAFPPTRHNLASFVYALHYRLAIPGNWGTWIMGIVAILWFFDCFIGAALTLPRGRPFLRKWRIAWMVRRSRITYDTHRAGGLWPWLLLAVIALSSVYLNLNREVFMPVFRLVAKTTPEPFVTQKPRPAAELEPPQVPLEQAIAVANAQAARLGWTETAQQVFYRDTLGLWQVYFEKPASDWARPGNYALFIHDRTAELVHVRAPGGTAGDVFLQWIAALHMGTILGAPYDLLLCVVGLAIAWLAGTGVVIWWRKRRARRHAGRTKAAGLRGLQAVAPADASSTPRPMGPLTPVPEGARQARTP